uniref:Uncharacterized protein n=1 Tax=viral metagenome TaxID=1070528 RepID=A0A6C0I6N2_9ZZZZ
MDIVLYAIEGLITVAPSYPDPPGTNSSKTGPTGL